MPNIKAIIFDLDDTLHLERDYVFSGFNAVAKAHEDLLGPWEESSEKMRKLFFDSEKRRRIFNILLEERGRVVTEDTIGAMIKTYRFHLPDISLTPEVDSLLSKLREKYKLGLITDGPVMMQAAKVEALDLRAKLDTIILTEEFGKEFAKPHPKAFEYMVEKLGIKHKECVYMGDNAGKDFLAPNKLGWLTIQFTQPDGVYKDVEPPPEGEAKYRITSLTQIEENI